MQRIHKQLSKKFIDIVLKKLSDLVLYYIVNLANNGLEYNG